MRSSCIPTKTRETSRRRSALRRINHANDVLSDAKKRKLYDEFGEVGLREGFDANRARQYSRWQEQSGGQGPDLSDLFGGGEGPVDMGSIFDRFFSGSARRGRGQSPFGGSMPFGSSMPIRGQDLEGEITVDLPQAVRGGEVSLNVNGRPVVVRIPPGASEGSRVRVPGKGASSPSGGSAGDLVLTIHVEAHNHYWLEGIDLHVEVPITLGEAYHGGKIRVPTPEGDINVTVRPHTQSGTKLRVRGKGVPGGKKRGPSDLIVHLMVAVPQSTAKDVSEAVDVVSRAYQGDVRDGLEF